MKPLLTIAAVMALIAIAALCAQDEIDLEAQRVSDYCMRVALGAHRNYENKDCSVERSIGAPIVHTGGRHSL